MVAVAIDFDQLPRYGGRFPRETIPWGPRDPSGPRPAIRSGESPWISDLAGPRGHEAIEPQHIAEAIGYRSIDGSGHDQRIERCVSSTSSGDRPFPPSVHRAPGIPGTHFGGR